MVLERLRERAGTEPTILPMPAIEVIQADITTLPVDAIVNAANESLLGGGGVDGAIHRAAGPQLIQACRPLAPCPTGQARLTPGFNLPAKFVIHTVGPVWNGGGSGEDELLADCYRNTLALAVQHDLHTIAFPAISTGVYGFPEQRAAPVAAASTAAVLAAHPALKVTFVCFSRRSLAVYAAAVSGR